MNTTLQETHMQTGTKTNTTRKPINWRLTALAGATCLLAACGGDAEDPVAVVEPEETRAHASRTFTADATATTFAAMPAAAGDVVDMASTSRWAGVLGGAAYQVEVPANWNGKLVMYAHGFRGEGAALTVGPPSIRRYLVQNG
jgi:hypothetical protein